MAPSPPTGGSDDSRETRRLWRLSGMGLELAAQVVAGMLLGWLADRFIAKDGYTWLVVGTIAGVLVGMTTFVKTALRESKLAAAAAPKMPRRDLSNEDEDGETED